VKHNFHLVLTYSPTGESFKERLVSHPGFLTCCTLIWMPELQKSDLAELGHYFQKQMEL
jgi:hypothetical protein